MVNPEKPDNQANSQQADNVFKSLPNDLTETARAVYQQAYMAFIAEKGNLPEEAHHAAMAAVEQHSLRRDDSTNDPPLDPSDLTAR